MAAAIVPVIIASVTKYPAIIQIPDNIIAKIYIVIVFSSIFLFLNIKPIIKTIIALIISVGKVYIAYGDNKSAKPAPIAAAMAPRFHPKKTGTKKMILSPACIYPEVPTAGICMLLVAININAAIKAVMIVSLI